MRTFDGQKLDDWLRGLEQERHIRRSGPNNPLEQLAKPGVIRQRLLPALETQNMPEPLGIRWQCNGFQALETTELDRQRAKEMGFGQCMPEVQKDPDVEKEN